MPRILFGLQSAFSLWMLYDAARRGAAYYWYPIILLPFGEFFYFFMVKIHDPDFLWLKQGLQRLTSRRPTLEQLRFRVRQTPNYDNQAALAEALHDRKEFHEAGALFEELCRTHEESPEVHLGLASCRMGLEDYENAVASLHTLLELQPTYQDYKGWTMLAEALHRLGRTEEAAGQMAKLVRTSPRLNHRLYYAHYLKLVEKQAEARKQLEEGLMEHEHAPRFLRRQQSAWARQAKQMLRQLA